VGSEKRDSSTTSGSSSHFAASSTWLQMLSFTCAQATKWFALWLITRRFMFPFWISFYVKEGSPFQILENFMRFIYLEEAMKLLSLLSLFDWYEHFRHLCFAGLSIAHSTNSSVSSLAIFVV
jgi:hypothetical protein